MIEQKKLDLHTIVPPAMWSVSGVIVIAIMVLVTGVPVPEWLPVLAGWYVAFVGPASLICGMYLVWHLPGWRRLIVIPVELFILFAGVGLFHVQVDSAKATEADSAYKAFLATAEYRTALDAYELAKKEWDAQASRIGKIPGDFTTGARLTKEASSEAETKFKAASAELIHVEKNAPKPAEEVTAAGAFRIFGKENQDAVQAWILFLLGLSYEAIALALSWSGVAKARKPAKDEQEAQEQAIVSHREWSADDYYRAMTSGPGGKLLGREKVMEILPGLPERKARELFAELVRTGRVVGGKSPKLSQLSGQPQWELGIDRHE